MISLCLTLAGFSAAAVQATPAPQADPPPVTVLPDVEVAARRGAARTPPQYEYDAARIDALAGGSVGDVLGQAARQFSPGQPPVIIINGVRMPDPSVFLDLPPDALERLEVLPAGSAAEYGGSPSGRVFNLVLQRSFASRDGALTAAAPTAGGFRELSATARQSGLQDRNITNLTLTLRDVSALLADDRQAYLRDHPDSAGVS
ncbi:MAG: Plug domain-containing protein, partial [Brevundimonas sp.]|nr:Plug domain-containing protein [Brevundimonas sp.]